MANSVSVSVSNSVKQRLYSFFRGAIFAKLGRHRVEYSTRVTTYDRTGHGCYYTTIGGKPIYHPSAYRWPKIYNASTVEIRINPYWAAKHLAAPRGYFWAVDADGLRLVQTASGQDYHPTQSEILLGAKAISVLLRKAVAARKKIAKINKKIGKLADRVWVSVEDSKKAGNCEAGTVIWASRHGLAECGAVRGDYLLSIEDSALTRGAVRIAVIRAGL